MMSVLKRAELLLCCERKDHNNCSKIVDSLMSGFKTVLEANTTRTTIDGQNYCVAGSMLIDDVKAFKEDIKRLKTDEGVGILYSKLFVED